VAEGQRADLLLLEANPLEDVMNADRRAGVMVRGRWFSESELQSLLDGLAASYAPSLSERLGPLALIALAVYLFLRSKRHGEKR